MVASSTKKPPSHFKPGKTINKHERHYVVHNYHDYSNEPDDPAKTPIRRRKGGVTTPFPIVLHRTIAQVEADGFGHIFGWQPHGRCFVIFKPKEFVDEVMPKYFNLNKLSSFQRQLNLYGFSRITRGPDAAGYYHEYFLRDREFLAKRMMRKRIKGTKIKGAYNPDLEPDFYLMPPVGHYICPEKQSSTSSMNAASAGPDVYVSSEDSSSAEKSCSSTTGSCTEGSMSHDESSSSSPLDTMVIDVSNNTLPEYNMDLVFQDMLMMPPPPLDNSSGGTTNTKPAVCNFVFPNFISNQDDDVAFYDETAPPDVIESHISDFIVDLFEEI